MRLKSSTELIEFGVDWITATATDNDSVSRLVNIGRSLLDEAKLSGDDVVPFGWKGYEGWTTGSIDVGKRSDSCLVRVHGGTANETWRPILAVAQSCTRLDVQATYRLEGESVPMALARAWRAAQRTKHFGKPVEWHYRRDRKKGNTLELGRRPSELFGRLYDKEKESRLPYYQNCLRCECEVKGALAQSMMVQLRRGTSVENILATRLSEFFRQRGVVLPHLLAGVTLMKSPQRCRSIDRYLEWLRMSVSAGVQRAVAERGLSATLEALGLTAYLPKDSDRPDGP